MVSSIRITLHTFGALRQQRAGFAPGRCLPDAMTASLALERLESRVDKGRDDRSAGHSDEVMNR